MNQNRRRIRAWMVFFSVQKVRKPSKNSNSSNVLHNNEKKLSFGDESFATPMSEEESLNEEIEFPERYEREVSAR
jgi:hypothetical protein